MHDSQEVLGRLSFMDSALFFEFGIGAKSDSPFQCVHHAIEFHALTWPTSVAVEEFQQTITYSELDRQANCLASRLRSIGVDMDSRVCILVERSILMVIGILAILKAGAAYVPLDGNIVSDSTLEHVLKDSGSSVVVALAKFAPRVHNTPTICLESSICREPNYHHCVKPRDSTTSKDGVYVIYTSGVPKGVDVSHGNVTNLVCMAPGNLGMAPGVRVSQLLNISFDMAAWEILGCLSNGGTLCLRGKTSKEWRAVMKTVDVVIATPSMLLPHDPSDYPSIKYVAVAGEPCPKALADSWGAKVKFYNSCGPTEITIVNTMHLYTPGEFLSIGRPTPNNTVYILDENMEPLPIGTTGVMWAGGAGITRGYVNLPDKTSERYRKDPFINNESMMFNTGDLGRWHPNGTLEHLGRIDNQVKVKGFRVELDGVASAMETCSGVQAAVALLINGELWGFVTPITIASDEVRAAVAEVQPYYAVPTKFLFLDEFPKTPNGKTDRRILQQRAIESTKFAVPSEEKKAPLGIVNGKPNIVPGDMFGLLPYQDKPQNPSIFSGKGILRAHGADSDPEASFLEQRDCAWSGYEIDILPEKNQSRFIRSLRHQIFSLYRRLFGIVFITNMAVSIFVATKGTNAQQLGGMVVANLFCAILMRQDYVINTLFFIFCSVPSSWPLSIRRVCARVYHIGGLHSGFAVSGVVWLTFLTGQATKEMVQNHKTSVATVAITYCILTFLIGIVIFAHPAVRSKFHNRFEMTHRFLGWTSTALVWCQLILLTNDYKAFNQSLGQALVRSPPFWLVVLMTGSIILPWVRLRKVDVRSEVLSNHAIRLHFDYVTPIAGSFTRISDDPLMEWHGFATVPEPGKTGYSLVVSKAGDWTTKQITNPPTKLWVRGIPTFGVLRIVPLFRRVVFVATGSGIGPCAPCILEKRIPIGLLWTSPNVRQTFGDRLVDSILDASPDAVIYDTSIHGKPDMVKLTYRLVKKFDAEAVCVISNQKLTQKIVYGMMSRGIPAFGAIWDS